MGYVFIGENEKEVIKPPVTQSSEEKWEEKRLDTYRSNHRGKNPRYNKAKK